MAALLVFSFGVVVGWACTRYRKEVTDHLKEMKKDFFGQ